MEPVMKNMVYVIQGEITCIITEMKKALRYPGHSSHGDDKLLVKGFSDLRNSLQNTAVTDGGLVDLGSVLTPFLELVRSEETSGYITGLALTSLNKFISYGYLDALEGSQLSPIESLADAVTHARFVGTDPESDEVVLMKILQVLRTLLLSPCGRKLSNEAVCEILQSCFRICFETRLSKLLRRMADNTLVEMVKVLFARLPEFTEDIKWSKTMRKLKMQARQTSKPEKKDQPAEAEVEESSKETDTQHAPAESNTAEAPAEGDAQEAAVVGGTEEAPVTEPNTVDSIESSDPAARPHMIDFHEDLSMVRQDIEERSNEQNDEEAISDENTDDHHHHTEAMDFINPRGIRFIPKKEGPIVPYGLPAIRELFRFLISITNSSDKQNTEEMSYMGIQLITVALENSIHHLPRYASLLSLVKNELCFNLFRLLQVDITTTFANVIRACFLLFESLRGHLKFQLEAYLTRIMSVIVSESPRISYEIREIALQGLLQLWSIPGFVTELYLNYDCDIHCSNLFEDITKLLSKNAFPVSGLFTTHILSLDALLTVIESVESQCRARIMSAKSGGSSTVTLPANVPSLDQIHSRKHQKQVYQHSVELFNQKPKQGISFLQEQGYLGTSHEDIVSFLKETPKLNKALIGEYISRKNNPELTRSYMKSFDMAGKRLDEALRMLLETFRLPGESPVIEFLMEHFSDVWFASNNSPFANTDAAFTLVYAIIMLNVDQHNHNAKKQNEPMTLAQFQRNLKGVNDGKDFDQDMLEEIFNAIRHEEIVLPEERTGLVKEVYTWKVLIGKGSTTKGTFISCPSGCYDNELFSIIWGPTIAALAFVFDKSQEQLIIQKAVSGYKKCAVVSAHFGLSEVFDNLIISLCKFTTFLNLNNSEAPDSLAIMFASNSKAQLAAKTVFNLAHRHGDMLREGWKNILDCMLTLYRAKLLPHTFTEVEDFLNPERRIKLIKENKLADSRSDSGVFSFLGNYFSTENQKSQNTEERQARETSKQVIEECELDSFIDDTKFLRTSSLQELVKALITLSQFPHDHVTSAEDSDTCPDEETTVFFLELLIRVVLQNRDRAGVIWQSVRDHLSTIILSSTDHTFLAERAVTGLLRIFIRLLCREEVASQVLPSLSILLRMKSTVLRSMSRQIAYGLHLLMETNAANIHSTEDWLCIFTLLEVIGAGGTVSFPTDREQDAQSDGEINSAAADSVYSERGYTSDSELYENSTNKSTLSASSSTDLTIGTAPDNASWLLVNKNQAGRTTSVQSLPHTIHVKETKPLHNQFSICLDEELLPHDAVALMKCSDILVLLVRDAAHITPYNFDSCVHTIRMFVEASMNATTSKETHSGKKHPSSGKHSDRKHKQKKDSKGKGRIHSQSQRSQQSIDEVEEVSNMDYKELSLRLLDLMHTLHTRAASIFQSWADESKEDLEDDDICDAKTSSLWRRCWCPLLQGLARLCTDTRMDVRWQALRELQRALLVQDLNQLSAVEWEACFNKVLFPLLTILLEKSAATDLSGIEETRFRASTLLSKVYLQHLHLLLTIPTFTALWLTILEFMDKFLKADHSGQLTEGIPELLKNMLLVMDGMQLFYDDNERTEETQLCKLTCDRLNSFLPSLKTEIFYVSPPPQVKEPEAAASSAAEMHTASGASETPVLPVAPNTNDTSDGAKQNPLSSPSSTPSTPPVVQRAPSPPVLPMPDLGRPTSPQMMRTYDTSSHHRSTSPLVHTMPASAFTIQLHPPLAPPKPMGPPTLLPVSSPPHTGQSQANNKPSS